jgi:hypothetical protein
MAEIALSDCVVRLEEGSILHLVWNHGVRIDAGNAKAAMEAVNEIADGKTYPLLVDMASTNDLSHHAREAFANPCAASRIALLGTGPVDRVIVAYQLRTGQVPCPTRFFTSRAEALGWLQDSGPSNPAES